jgi:hypothetical protein
MVSITGYKYAGSDPLFKTLEIAFRLTTILTLSINHMNDTNHELRELLETYSSNVQDTALSARALITKVMPDVKEMVDRSARVIGYGFGAGYTDMICTIILSKTGVKLGLVAGAGLPDPKRLLEGTGKRHRYVALAKASDLEKPGLESLLRAGVAAWKKRSKAGGE